MNVAGLIHAASADNIANVDSQGYKPWEVNPITAADGSVSATAAKSQNTGVDLASDMVGLATSSVAYKANARAFEMGADAEKSVFDKRV
jgi:flagellar basal body rod protein FlgB